jgi:hypothetical protein
MLKTDEAPDIAKLVASAPWIAMQFYFNTKFSMPHAARPQERSGCSYLSVHSATAGAILLQIEDQAVKISAAIIAAGYVDGSLTRKLRVSPCRMRRAVTSVLTYLKGSRELGPYMVGIPYPQLFTTLMRWVPAATFATSVPRAATKTLRVSMV